ncbi:AMP-binding protein [bacterium]|nr:AMP-binding protein [bacterium]NIO18662.1 AMP-binding protein [bacterium]NIO73693.1 AMP-binding protein [bacterium]
MNVGEILEESVARFGEKVAVVFENEKVTFPQLDRLVNNLSTGLIKEGVNKGDCVATFLPDSMEFALSYFAILKIGAIHAPLDIRLKEDEVKLILDDARPVIIITTGQFQDMFLAMRAEIPVMNRVIVVGKEVREGCVSFDEIKSRSSPRVVPAEVEDDDVALYIYTSGTTAKPKGVMVTFGNLDWFPRDMHAFWNTTENDVYMIALPASHISGPIVFNQTVAMGIASVILGTFSPRKWLESIEKNHVTATQLVPPMANALIQLGEFEKYNLSSLRGVALMGAYSAPGLVKEIGQKLGLRRCCQGYGLTETSPMITFEPLDSNAPFGNIGKPLPGRETKIVDEDGDEVSVGKIGEIVTRGPHIMKGYHNDPEATREKIRNGWLHTGDLAKRDEEGYFYIVGRKQDRINVGGLMVYVSEVEDVLREHPKIVEVAVMSAPDPKRGEKVRAIVVLKDGIEATEDEIIVYCRERMANYKVPREVEFRESLPKTRTGKIARAELVKNSY